MLKKIVAICATSILLIIALYIYKRFYPQPSLEIQYYFIAFFSSASILIAIWLIWVIGQLSNYNHLKIKSKFQLNKKNNRRKSYRLSYPQGGEPMLQVKRCNDNINRPYLLKIIDLSENGLKIQHNGLLKKQDLVSGYITFSNGERLDIIGKVIHLSGSEASLQLEYSLPSKLLIEEQRRLLFLNHQQATTRKI